MRMGQEPAENERPMTGAGRLFTVANMTVNDAGAEGKR
jgi:hypothetical protein